MDTLLYDLLFSPQARGGLWAFLLFCLCFLCIHLVKLATLGWRETQKKTPTPPPKKEPTEEKRAVEKQPVYYIVERKRRVNKSYGEPKKISFKE